MKALILGFLLLIPAPVLAATLLLIFEFPRAYQPQPASFHISYTTSVDATGTIDEMTVPLSAIGACGGGPDTTEDTYCAAWPACPADGTVMLFWIQAVWAAGESGPSNSLLCQFSAAHPCECLAPGQEAPGAALASAPVPTSRAPVAPPAETQPQHWTDALAAVLSAAPAPAT